MLYKITGNQPFQVNSDSFSISPSESGYDLYLSADGVNYSNFVTVASGVTKQMVNMNSGNYYILSGNTSTVTVNWERECGGGSGSAAGVSSLDGQTGALTTKTINGNAILGSGNIEISGGSEAYILDKMTQSERAEFCTNFLTLTDEEKIATLVYRDNVLCRYSSVESTKVWFTLDFFEVPSLYPYTQVRKFALKSDGSFEDSVNTKYPLGTSLNVDYSAHTITANQTTFAGFARGINNGLLLPYAIVTNNSTKILSTNNVTVEKTGYNDGIITVSFDYSGKSITGVWNFIGNTATLVSWTEGQPSQGGGDYVIVDALSAITSPKEGMIAYVSTSISTYTGWELVNDQSEGYVAYIKDSGETETLANVYRSGDDYHWDWNNDGGWYSWANGEVKGFYRKNLNNNYFDIVFEDASLVSVVMAEQSYSKTPITYDSTNPSKTYEYKNGEWLEVQLSERICVLDELSRDEVVSLFNELMVKTHSGLTGEYNLNEYKFYSKITEDDFYGYIEVNLARINSDREMIFTGTAGWKNGEGNYNKVFVMDNEGNTSSYQGMNKMGYNVMLKIADITGGTPEWITYDGSLSPINYLKDRHDGKTNYNIGLFFDYGDDPNNPYLVYAECTSWYYRYDLNETYFVFDDIEIGGTRYRGVYMFAPDGPNPWVTVYWDTYKNYIASL